MHKKSFPIFSAMKCYSLWLSLYNSSRLFRVFWWTLLFWSVHICSLILKDLSWPIFQYGKRPSLAKICCVAHDLLHRALSCWKNLTFIQVWYQIPLQQLNIFGTIQVINFSQLSWTVTFHASSKHQILTPKLPQLAGLIEYTDCISAEG